jgi:hypothetical protein
MSGATSNVELAHTIQAHNGRHASPSDRRRRWVEIVEAVLLAAVAVATAWSGYQAARWDSLSTSQYSLAARTTVAAQGKMTLAGQDRLYDITTFQEWVAAKTAGNDQLAAFYERRFRPEYAVAFAAWQKLDPLHNPAAPAGPIFMAEYTNGNSRESATLTEQVKEYFENGVSARETGDNYVKVTVFLATVLLLTALGQRFEIFGARVAVLAVAAILLVVSASLLFTLGRA